MSHTFRAVILVNKSQTELLSACILSKPLIEHIAEALIEVGVESLVVAGAPFFPEVSSRFSDFSQIESAAGAAAEIRKQDADMVFIFSAPALVDAAALSELRSQATAIGATVLMSSGIPLIYAVPRGADESIFAAVMNGETGGLCIADSAESAGTALPVSSLIELARSEEALRDRVNAAHIRAGVRITGMSSVWISPDVRIGTGTEILPNTIIKGKSKIGDGCIVGPNAVVDGCVVGHNTKVNASQVFESSLGDGVTVGPFAYIRPHCVVGDGCRVGDFVELKNSNLGSQTKVSHLAYVGDSDVGERVNFSCGAITTNYDGVNKHRTTIGDDAFVGCNSNLIAPVTVEDRAYVAAGTTVTNTVPAEHLAIGRVRQENKPNWWARIQKMKAEKKK